MSTKVLVVDDHALMRDGLCSLISKEPDLTVVGDAADGRAAVELALELEPDLIIMDVDMKGLNGIEATRQILSQRPGIKVVAVSMHGDRRFVTGMLKAKASGYVLKDSAFEELVFAARAVLAGETYLSPSVAKVVVSDYVQQLTDGEKPSDPLTAREREVLQLLAEGATTKQIATQLLVSEKTVETHRARIRDKLQIQSLADLIKYAIREGITSLHD